MAMLVITRWYSFTHFFPFIGGFLYESAYFPQIYMCHGMPWSKICQKLGWIGYIWIAQKWGIPWDPQWSQYGI
jgi:hypothetical protein